MFTLQVLDGPQDELRRDALDTLCAMAVVLGQDFNMFVPTIRKVWGVKMCRIVTKLRFQTTSFESRLKSGSNPVNPFPHGCRNALHFLPPYPHTLFRPPSGCR